MSDMNLRDLRPGMILEEDAYTPNGAQLVMTRGTILDERRIARLAFYGVKVAKVTIPEGMTVKTRPPKEERAAEGTQSQPASATPSAAPSTVLVTPAAPTSSQSATQSALARTQSGPGEKPLSYGEKLRSSASFKKFKMDFEDSYITYQRNINEVIYGNKPINMVEMTEPVYDLIHDCYGPSNIFSMLHALRSYNDATYVHSINVALIAHSLGVWMHLPADDLQLLTEAGLLLDIGKIMVPQEILNKTEPLTSIEESKLRMHPQLGYHALQKQKINSHIKNTVLMHHERCDGSGYPRHLTINQIDPVARVIAIADVYDAMTAERLYRDPFSPFDVLEQIEADGYRKFDPWPLMTFMECVANTYIGNRVRLSDGTEGEVVYINPNHYARPTIQTGPASFIDLNENPKLRVLAII